MMPLDTRLPCASCGRKDIRLETCDYCSSRICSSCWILHVEYDHRDRYKKKKKELEDENRDD